MNGWLLVAGIALAGPVPDPGLPSPDDPINAERHVPVLFQKQAPLCLPTAAAAVAQFYGMELDPGELARDVPITRYGVKWDDIVFALNERGIRTVQLRADPTALREVLRHGTPVVIGQATGTRGHSIVVERYEAERDIYVVMDPANPGLEALKAEQLEARAEPTGYRGFLIAPPG